MKCRPIFSITLVVTALVGTIYSVQGTIPFFTLNLNGQVAAVYTASNPAGITLYISQSGNDGNPGTVSSPLKTLGAARDKIRQATGRATNSGEPSSSWKGAEIIIRGGIYYIDNAISFDGRDQGTERYPLVIRAMDNEKVSLTGAVPVSGWEQVSLSTDSWAYNRIPSGARGNVYRLNLNNNGIGYTSVNTGKFHVSAYNGDIQKWPRLFVNHNLKKLSRYPYSVDGSGVANTDPVAGSSWIPLTDFDHTLTPDNNVHKTTWVQIAGSVAQAWDFSKQNIMGQGIYAQPYNVYWEPFTAASNVNGQTKLTISPNSIWSAFDYSGQPAKDKFLSFANGLEFMTKDSFTINNKNGYMYYWSPSGVPTNTNLAKSETLIKIGDRNDASKASKWITFENLKITGSTDKAIDAGYGVGIRFKDDDFEGNGQSALFMTDMKRSGVEGGSIHDMAQTSAMSLHGGNALTLEKGDNYIKNVHFYNLGYDMGAAIEVAISDSKNLIGQTSRLESNGSGLTISGNTFEDIADGVIGVSSAFLTIENNVFRRTNYLTGDSGAITMAASFSTVGVIIRNNLFKDIRNVVYQPIALGAVQPIYLDGITYATIEDNVFDNIETGIHYYGKNSIIRRNKFSNIDGHQDAGILITHRWSWACGPTSWYYDGIVNGLAKINFDLPAWQPYKSNKDYAKGGSKESIFCWVEPNDIIVDNMVTDNSGALVQINSKDTPKLFDSTTKTLVGNQIYKNGFAIGPNLDQLNYQYGSSGKLVAGHGNTPLVNLLRVDAYYLPKFSALPIYEDGSSSVTPTADTTTPTISVVSSSNLTTNGATITWTTNEVADTQVEYGLTTTYGSNSALNTAKVTSHSVTLSSLQANTAYNYRVKSRDTAGNLATSPGYSFTTKAPLVAAPIPTITSPANSTSIVSGSSASISVSLSGDASNLSVVEFYDGTTKIGQDSTSPYSISFTPSAGSHTLSVRAVNTNGLSASSQGISVTVTTPTTIAPPPSTTTSGSTGIAQGLVAYYAFDEGQGNTATDSSGNGNTASLVNSPTRATGKIGQALSLDGVDDTVNLGTVGDSEITTQMSVSVWVYRKPSTLTFTPIIYDEDYATNKGYYLGDLDVGGDEVYKFRVNGDRGNNFTAAESAMTFNTWTHYVGVFDGDFIYLYKNGVLAQSVSHPSSSVTIDSGGAFIGSLLGSVDDVRIYSRALSATEVALLYAYDGSVPTIPHPATTSSGPADADGDSVLDNLDKCPNTPLSLVTQVNERGCPKPITSTFDIKPNFSNQDLTGVPSLELGRSNFGKLLWNVPVKLVSGTDNQLNLDQAIKLEQNKVTVDTNTAPELNRPATVTLYNITSTNPKIMKDGVLCTACQIISFSNGTLIFSIPGFSTYEVVSGSGSTQTSSPVNGMCGESQNQCLAGTLSDQTNSSTDYIWQCLGSNGGTASSCSISKPVTESAPSGRGGGGSGRSTNSNSSSGSVSTPIQTQTTIQSYATSFFRDLALGATGPDVQTLQKFLNDNGYVVSIGGVDSTGSPRAGSKGQETTFFGPATKTALIRYQKSIGLSGTGYFGPLTRARIQGSSTTLVPSSTQSSTLYAPSSTILSRTLYRGMTGEDVRTLQKLLNQKGYIIAKTGAGSLGLESTFFGLATETALKRFQCATLSICSGTIYTTGYGLAGQRTRGALGN